MQDMSGELNQNREQRALQHHHLKNSTFTQVNQREWLESQIHLQTEASFLLGCGTASLGHLCSMFRYHIVVVFAGIERFMNNWHHQSQKKRHIPK